MRYIIGLTCQEIINKRILHLGMVLTVLFMAFYGIGLHYIVQQPGVHSSAYLFVVQQAGYQMLFLGWFCCTFLMGTMAILMGAGSISRELETGTILNLASRPLSRNSIILGKYLAYGLMSLIYTMVLTGSVGLLASHFFHLHIVPAQLFWGLWLFSLLPLLLLAVTTYCSTAHSTLAAGVTGFMLFAVAIIGGFIEQIGAMMNNAAMVKIGVITSLLLPTDAAYRLAVHHILGSIPMGSAEMTMSPFGVASLPSTWAEVYIFAYLAVLLLFTLLHFSNRDL
ncbi:MAG TPA: ABC transporter permease subunit [Syntrophomonadaceae bacterium]|nr:ABC transporter permease subunit [Syntrophomonadaceae bacterium]